MTIRDYILARTGEAGGEVEGAEFAYSTSTGQSGVGEAVPAASRVSPGPAEWFSGKTAGGLGLLPLLPFLGSGGSPEGMEEAYNEAYGENAAQAAEAAEASGEMRSASGQRSRRADQGEKAETKPQSTEPIRKQEVIVPDYVRKETQTPEALQTKNTYVPLSEQINRITAGKYVGPTLDINQEYPEAQKLETLDITQEYPEAQRLETLDITKTYPDAIPIDEPETFRAGGAGRTFDLQGGAGRQFGEPLTRQQLSAEQAYRKAMDPERSLAERMSNYAAYQQEKSSTSPARMAADVGAYALAAPVIAGGSALLGSGVAAIPTAVQFGAENAGNAISQAVPKITETAEKAGNVINFSDLARKASGLAAGIGGIISSYGAAAESPAISSPGTSGNWDAASQKVTGTGTTKLRSTGTSTKLSNVTTKITKVK